MKILKILVIYKPTDINWPHMTFVNITFDLIIVAICNTVVISAEQQEKIVRVAPKRKTKTPVFEKAFLTPLREFGQSISGSIARKSKLRDGSTSGQGSTDCQVRIGTRFLVRSEIWKIFAVLVRF